jgi:uncharacterized protein YciI
MELEAFELVILRRPAGAPELDEVTLDRLQAEHLAFYRRMREAGHVVTNGPLLDAPDDALRGLAFFRTGSLEEARRLAETDSSVAAGRLAVDVMTWWCPAGSMAVRGAPLTVPDP